MSFHYSGDELPLMARAIHWKAYIASHIRPYLGASVLEVGAGIGGFLPYLFQPPVRAWTALEPDPTQAAEISHPHVQVVTGTLADLEPTGRYDTILYLDVLEHIEDDAAELRDAALRLAPAGCLVVLAPAHPFLFSPMDAAVGHHRRYVRGTLAALTPPGCRLERLIYLDAAGILASVANRVALRTSRISPGQLRLWDTVLVPVSRRVDRWLGYRLGKSVLAVWRRA